jgi:phosphoribosyl-AMP cyclohydrolase
MMSLDMKAYAYKAHLYIIEEELALFFQQKSRKWYKGTSSEKLTCKKISK